MVFHEIMIVCFFNVLALAIFALNSFKFIYMKLEHRKRSGRIHLLAVVVAIIHAWNHHVFFIVKCIFYIHIWVFVIFFALLSRPPIWSVAVELRGMRAEIRVVTILALPFIEYWWATFLLSSAGDVALLYIKVRVGSAFLLDCVPWARLVFTTLFLLRFRTLSVDFDFTGNIAKSSESSDQTLLYVALHLLFAW